jgi:hypothetical protein
MCVIPVFQHSCGCRKPFKNAVERCHLAEEQNVEECDHVEEEVIEEPSPCIDCFESQSQANEDAQVEVAMQESTRAYQEMVRQQEEDEYARAIAESIEGVSLEDRWEVDDKQMAMMLKQSRMDYYKKQEDDLRAKGHISGNRSLPRGEWTQRETIHDRQAPGGGPPTKYAFAPQGYDVGFDDEDDEEGEEEKKAPPPPPPEDPGNKTKRLQDYPLNVGPDGRWHPLILHHFMGCSHDIEGGVDYSREVSRNEPNAVRLPRPGKCPVCGGKPALPHLPVYAGKDKGKGKAVEKVAEVSGGNNALPPPKEEEPPERELSPAEMRAKRLAMLNSSKAGPSA